jgi:iron complex transport system ATP-binding protein
MLKLQNIQYNIGSKIILENVNVQFEPNKFNIILGQNGSGKSSLLKIFCGQTKNYKGNVLYNDTNLQTIRTEDIAKHRAVMSQLPTLSFPLKVSDVVMMGRYPHFHFSPTKKDEHICQEAIELMNLQIFADRNYLTLSGGEKQRVQYARVLAQIWEQPTNEHMRYLFLDEPITSLDVKYQQEFLKIAKGFINENTIVIAIMHELNLAIQFADHLFFLKEGKLIANGVTNNILSADLLEKVFDVKVEMIYSAYTEKPYIIFK